MSEGFDFREVFYRHAKEGEYKLLLKALNDDEFFDFVFMYPGYDLGIRDQHDVDNFNMMLGALYRYYNDNDVPNKVDIVSVFQNELIKSINDDELFLDRFSTVGLYECIKYQKYNQENNIAAFSIDIEPIIQLFVAKFHEKEAELKEVHF
ncbi:MAG: hypothetical protein MJ135_06055, partial [Oscillospiraceae bacterium]|nr:hypothetical protein [Oscillospiraceae bacterium]